MIYTPEQRKQISKEAKGKKVKKLEWIDDLNGSYWVMTFTDNSEICFRFMAELV